MNLPLVVVDVKDDDMVTMEDNLRVGDRIEMFSLLQASKGGLVDDDGRMAPGLHKSAGKVSPLQRGFGFGEPEGGGFGFEGGSGSGSGSEGGGFGFGEPEGGGFRFGEPEGGGFGFGEHELGGCGFGEPAFGGGPGAAFGGGPGAAFGGGPAAADRAMKEGVNETAGGHILSIQEGIFETCQIQTYSKVNLHPG